MTRDEVQEATQEAAVAAEHLAAHAERLIARMASLFPLEGATLMRWEDEERERLHALLRMFDQLYDMTSRKLFRGLLFLSGETIAGLSAQNQFRRIEALGGIASADRWIELGTTRNVLAHDYPTRPAKQAERANLAWRDLPDLIAGTRRIISLLQSEGLIP
ncbi:hypothetical protein [Sphingomonas adhaesiva]|uniref:hypothetical protein n=1 Tax=Sphingomonas adhaesiva TaxID=28212 RepID=UPI002FF5D5E2